MYSAWFSYFEMGQGRTTAEAKQAAMKAYDALVDRHEGLQLEDRDDFERGLEILRTGVVHGFGPDFMLSCWMCDAETSWEDEYLDFDNVERGGTATASCPNCRMTEDTREEVFGPAHEWIVFWGDI